MDSLPLYRQLADHYLGAIRAGTLAHGERMPSVRAMMRLHDVSLSTALQTCRQLESEGWIEARPRSGYFVRQRSILRNMSAFMRECRTSSPKADASRPKSIFPARVRHPNCIR